MTTDETLGVPFPSCGFVNVPSPIQAVPDSVARPLGAAWIGVKRDDLILALFGGTKVRKLDLLLAAEPFCDAAGWVSAGALGSGHLVALGAAAERLKRHVDVHVFRTPLSKWGLENLAYVASHARALRFHRSRAHLFVARPHLVLGGKTDSLPVVLPGASHPVALVGLVRAAQELKHAVDSGECPRPDVIVLPLGTAGTAVGLSVGLGLCGLNDVQILAACVVERALSMRRRIRALTDALVAFLARGGVDVGSLRPAPIVLDRSALGAGYAWPTTESVQAAHALDDLGIVLDPVYGGKAWAALLRHAAEYAKKNVLFWNTARRGPLEFPMDWMSRLPLRLQRFVDAEKKRLTQGEHPRKYWTRRKAIVAGGLATLSLSIVRRTACGYDDSGDRASTRVLDAREVAVLLAAIDVVLDPSFVRDKMAAVENVDRFVDTLSGAARREVRAMLFVIEHAPLRLGFWKRFSSLLADERRKVLADYQTRGGLLALCAQGMKELVALGYYQSPESWRALEYSGPWVPASPRPSSGDALGAPKGTRPRAWERDGP